MATKGVIMYAKTNFNCLQCDTTLKAGERTPHQTLCSVGRDTKELSECQKIWYSKKKQAKQKALQFIYCDVCHKKIPKKKPRQLRCISEEDGVLTECQIIAKKVQSQSPPRKVRIKSKKSICLKCGRSFVGKGAYNRICEVCSAINERMASNIHKMTIAAPC